MKRIATLAPWINYLEMKFLIQPHENKATFLRPGSILTLWHRAELHPVIRLDAIRLDWKKEK